MSCFSVFFAGDGLGSILLSLYASILRSAYAANSLSSFSQMVQGAEKLQGHLMEIEREINDSEISDYEYERMLQDRQTVRKSMEVSLFPSFPPALGMVVRPCHPQVQV